MAGARFVSAKFVTLPRVAISTPARYTRYPVTATLSEDSAQCRSIRELEAAVTTNRSGIEGAMTSMNWVLALAVSDIGEKFPAASSASTV